MELVAVDALRGSVTVEGEMVCEEVSSILIPKLAVTSPAQPQTTSGGQRCRSRRVRSESKGSPSIVEDSPG